MRTDIPEAVRAHIHEFKDSLTRRKKGQIYAELLEMLHDPRTCDCTVEDYIRDEVIYFAHTEYAAYAAMVWRAIHDTGPNLVGWLRMRAKDDNSSPKAHELEESFPQEESQHWPTATL